MPSDPPRDMRQSARALAFAGLLAIAGPGLVACAGAAWAIPDPGAIAPRLGPDLGLQTTLPTDPADKAKPEFEEESQLRLHLPASVAEMVLWAALVVGVGFALYALRDTLPARSRRVSLKPGDPPLEPLAAAAVERMEETALEADDLARRGQIAEAMHILLLRSLAELRKRLDITLADSLTSREILSRLRLPEGGRSALADLIRRVERAYFGAYPSDSGDYDACRAAYDRLTGAMLGDNRA